MVGGSGFFDAYDEAMRPLVSASNLLQLLAWAEQVGLLAALGEPVPPDELPERTALTTDTAMAACNAMLAAGVLESSDVGIVLSAPWRVLTGSGAFVPLSVALAQSDVSGRLLRGAGNTYWTLPVADRLTFARAVSPDPYSDELVAAVRADLEADPEQSRVLAGGRALELGCGVAGRILTYLRAVPELSAVGVELDQDLAGEAQRRASDLGIGDRFTVVCCDAADFADDEPFDYGFWSQFFFAEQSRSGALANLRRSIRSGGRVTAPVGADVDAIRANPTSTQARDWWMFRVILASWGVPERDPAQLVAEFEDAGFNDVTVVRRGLVPTPGVSATVP